MQRRHFLGTALASSITMPAFALDASNPYRKNIGIQLYTLRNELKNDIPGTIKAVADAGYRQVEPYGFPDPDSLRMIDEAKAHGMAVHSTHFAWESVTDPDKEGVKPFAEILDRAKEAGLSHLVVPYVHEHNRGTLDDCRRIAARCNAAAAAAKKAGIQLSYHNHNFEFEPKTGGRTAYDLYIDEFSPEMMFEIDVFWVKVAGVDPAELVRRLKGRVSQLHLKDLQKGSRIPNFGSVPAEAFKELGNGMIPMEPIIEAAADAGVAHCHVEQDQSPHPLASIRQSIACLDTL